MSPTNAKDAFDQGLTYRPQVWGKGSMPDTPCEDGVELVDGELILFAYHNHMAANRVPWTNKKALARKPAPPQEDEFQTEYQEVI